MENAKDSKKVTSLLASHDKVEALSWLEEDEKHGVGEMDSAESIAMVKNLYKLGALHVFAVKITSNRDYSSTDYLIVKLPRDRFQRDEIFSAEGKRAELMGLDATEDVGQQHILAWFD